MEALENTVETWPCLNINSCVLLCFTVVFCYNFCACPHWISAISRMRTRYFPAMALSWSVCVSQPRPQAPPPPSCVWTACLCWLEEWQPNGFKWMAKLMCMQPFSGDCSYTTVFVCSHPQHYDCGFLFWHDSIMCIACRYIFLPLHKLSQPDCSLVGKFHHFLNFEFWNSNFVLVAKTVKTVLK